MSAHKDFSGAERLHLVNSERTCLCCGGPQRYAHCTPGRNVYDLDALYRVTSQVVFCTTPGCRLFLKDTHPPDELALAPPYKGFSWRVIAETGRLRFGERLTREAIKERLVDEHPTLRIGERAVNDLYNLYGALVSGANLEDPTLIAEVKANHAMVVSLDGAEPMLGHESVWFLRDLISARTFVARAMRSVTAKDLVMLLELVKEFARRHGIAVLGVVSDGQQSIRKAVKEVFPRVPHQLCQIHYVKRLAGELVEQDRHLRKELRKPFRVLREVERDVAAARTGGELSGAQAEVLEDLCLIIRSILRDDGKPPFDPPGLKLYERLTELRAKIRQMGREKGGPVCGRSTDSWRSSNPSETTSAGFVPSMGTSGRSGKSSSQRARRPREPSASSAS
jgi:hypothetical protein